MKAVAPTSLEELRSQSITILKLHENVKVSLLLQKWSNQNGGIIWSTTHHDQSPCQIWSLSDQWFQRSCIHGVKRDGRKAIFPILLYVGHITNKLSFRQKFKTDFKQRYIGSDTREVQNHKTGTPDDQSWWVRYDLNLTQGCLRFNDLAPFTVFDSFSHAFLPYECLFTLSK